MLSFGSMNHRILSALRVVAISSLAVACGAADATDETGSVTDELQTGEYISNATDIGDAPYIGDWEHNWGYVLGYLAPHAKIYAQLVTGDSVYGLIGNSGYGAWDHGHHCGWVSLKGLHGSGGHSTVANVCPPPFNDFSLASGQPSGLFRPGTVVVSNGDVQPAVVLPTCPDFTVYANYDPATRSFHDPDGKESPGRGTPGYRSAEQVATSGYSGFGTRFVTADGVAVEIKDTQRGGNVTAFGFMRRECIAGAQVGDPSPGQCGQLNAGDVLYPNHGVSSCGGEYTFVVQDDGNLVEYRGTTPLWASNTVGHGGDHLVMQSDGNLVLYAGSAPLWNSRTEGHPGARFSIQDDGNIVVYDGATPIWARFGL